MPNMNQTEPKSEQKTTKKRKRIPVRHIKFLEEYGKCGNLAEAYVAAGYKAKSKHSASQCGSQLLKKLDQDRDFLEIFNQVGLGDREIATIMSSLLRHKDPRIQAQTLNIATRCKGWQKDMLDVAPGATIVIGVKKEGKKEIAEKEKKPIEKGPITVTD